MTRKILVTGGAGFIGSHLSERAQREGYDVTIVDNLSSGKREQVPQGAAFAELDVRSPEAAALVRDGGFDVIVHLAAQMDVRRSVADPVFDAQVNVLGSLNLLEAVRAGSPRSRVVFSSTGGALYGDFDPPPSPESSEKNPEAPYGIGKLATEYYLAYYSRVQQLDTAVVRYGNVYGPRQDPHGEAGVVAIFCNRLLEGTPLTVFGDGEQTRDYVSVDDVVEATWRVATRTLPPAGRMDARAFNVGTGVGSSVLTLAGSLCRAAGVDARVEHAPERKGEMRCSVLNVEKASQQLGWRAAVPLDEGLAATWRWFAARHAASGRSG